MDMRGTSRGIYVSPPGLPSLMKSPRSQLLSLSVTLAKLTRPGDNLAEDIEDTPSFQRTQDNGRVKHGNLTRLIGG